MPDFSRWGANGGDPSLNAIGRTDRYLDALAAEQPVYATDPADAELANLMAGWRDDVRRPPIAHVAHPHDAEIVLQRALGARRRTRTSMAVLGSVAASLLCLGGFGAVVYGAGPGDALYGLRVSLFGERQVTRDDQVALAAQTEMQQVQQLIDQGNWTEAQDKLQTVTSTVQTVEDPQQQQELQHQLNQLSVKVENRDPNATVPAAPRRTGFAQCPGAAVARPGDLRDRCPSRLGHCRSRCRSCPAQGCRQTFRCRRFRFRGRCRCRTGQPAAAAVAGWAEASAGARRTEAGAAAVARWAEAGAGARRTKARADPGSRGSEPSAGSKPAPKPIPAPIPVPAPNPVPDAPVQQAPAPAPPCRRYLCPCQYPCLRRRPVPGLAPQQEEPPVEGPTTPLFPLPRGETG